MSCPIPIPISTPSEVPSKLSVVLTSGAMMGEWAGVGDARRKLHSAPWNAGSFIVLQSRDRDRNRSDGIAEKLALAIALAVAAT